MQFVFREQVNNISLWSVTTMWKMNMKNNSKSDVFTSCVQRLHFKTQQTLLQIGVHRLFPNINPMCWHLIYLIKFILLISNTTNFYHSIYLMECFSRVFVALPRPTCLRSLILAMQKAENMTVILELLCKAGASILYIAVMQRWGQKLSGYRFVRCLCLCLLKTVHIKNFDLTAMIKVKKAAI